MNKSIARITACIFSIFILSKSASSQDLDFGTIFNGGIDDAATYLEKYSNPIMQSFNNGLGSGWYNTAKPHKIAGFDLTATVNVANIPSGEKTFEFNATDFENLTLVDGSSTLPTAVGGASDSQLSISGSTEITGSVNGIEETIVFETNEQFDAPGGFDTEDFAFVGVPVPAIQLGIGLPKNTDLKIRYASDFGALEDDGSLTLLGFGVLHDVKQWIPGIKQLPLDIAGFVGYTSLNAKINIEESETDFSADGQAVLRASSFTLQAVASKKLAILTPYIGIGYNVAGSSIDVEGDFVYTGISTATGTSTDVTVTDPISLDFDGGSSARLNAGMRLKLAVLTFHAEYAVQKYNTLTFGVGLSIR